jgi:hypothetical protein
MRDEPSEAAHLSYPPNEVWRDERYAAQGGSSLIAGLEAAEGDLGDAVIRALAKQESGA